MQFEEFVADLDRDITAAGLRAFIVREQSQFLDCGSEFFVELVLNEGSKIHEAERLLKGAADALRADGAILDGVVRAMWKITEIRSVGHALSASGFPLASECFTAELRSGDAICNVTVHMTFSAIELLRGKRLDASCSNQKNVPCNEIAAVRRYLEHQLSCGGMSYWNPLKYKRCELNEPAMLYLVSRVAQN